MELPRQDPDQLLRAIRNDASTKKSGKLKIFFGYAAGVGKTYAMLQAAHQAKERGIDVVAGYIEPHARPQTMALLDGLEQLPVKQVAYEGMTLREFDIDAALKRNPQLILVDELAHTNAESSRHTKRYQDVQELLNTGIDVYTTVNVQHIESLNDTFTIMFIVTLLSGSLATRLKENAKQSAHTAYRTKILFETNQLLQKEQDENAVITATAGQLMKLLKKDIVVYLSDGKELATPNVFRAVNSIQEDLISENEKAVADWAFRNNKHAGATTDTLSSAKCLYLAIRVNQNVYGVAGIAVNGTPLDSFENSVLLSILGECALALENIKNAKEKEEAAVLAQNEQLRANLLRAISHDLRTPLTAISGSADNLLANYKKMDDALREQTFTDIYDDSMWLINLVENLLAVTRIEGGQVNLTRSIELMDEVVSEALKHINRKSKEHTIRVTSGKDFILAHIDAKLIVQVIINLVDNAIKYTPVGSVIEIHTDQKEQWVTVSVSDNGPGIHDEQKPRIFDMFYSGANKVVDSRRSLGLGLSLCKSIVTAHGGTISVSDNQPNGTVFKFTLPAEEVELHE